MTKTSGAVRTPWQRALDSAGITTAKLRRDYTTAARRLLTRETAGYAAVRALLPARLQPHLVAATAFSCATDDIVDAERPVAVRTAAFGRWREATRTALDTGRSRFPVLRAYAHTAAVCEQSPGGVLEYLEGTAGDLEFTGFETEAAYQAYVDRLTLPFLMISTGLQYPGGGDPAVRARWRPFADASQRLDFLTDLHTDLRAGRLCLPREDLTRHGVTVTDLAGARDTYGVRRLIAETCARTRAALTEAHGVLEIATPDYQPLVRAGLSLWEHRLNEVERRGAAVLRRPVSTGIREPLSILLRETRERGRERERGQRQGQGQGQGRASASDGVFSD
ncbi:MULTISPECIES: phytoene/squalene synthase family protein [Streptomyces]|uniref:phytoene/squalene synthase family protein n=1 Tax=Streptomyces TaxID=1883 RepID=UPI00131CA2F6|nr:phytoene/squalene synthase family protein [Streptomyces avermitilis]MYS99513.1 squalene/phytoene synthase family protein [Streptomyces sp. SID5469]